MAQGRSSLESLGELQRQVLDVVWKHKEATVHDVRDDLARRRPLAYTTVLTVMQKLEKAGWLVHRAEGRTYVYRPARSREQAGRSSLRRLLTSAFKGDRLALVQHLLDDEGVTDDELTELSRMIERRRSECGHE